jgi:hypothetical protein
VKLSLEAQKFGAADLTVGGIDVDVGERPQEPGITRGFGLGDPPVVVGVEQGEAIGMRTPV